MYNQPEGVVMVIRNCLDLLEELCEIEEKIKRQKDKLQATGVDLEDEEVLLRRIFQEHNRS